MTASENGSTFVYVTIIRTTPARLWEALLGPAFQEQYWFGMRCESQWKAGSPWQLVYPDGRLADTGEVLEADAPRRLVIRWRNEWKPEMKAEGDSLCTMEIEALDGAVQLTVTHAMDRPASRLIGAVSWGWPRILSNLKSLLETGAVALKAL